MMTSVAPRRRMFRMIAASVWVSSALVASSMTMMRGLPASARAISMR